MNHLSSLTSTRTQAAREFNSIHLRAMLNSWLAKILMKDNGLRSFVGSNVSGVHGSRLMRTRRIRVDQIVGTIRYTEEFDKDFRPLDERSRERWVQAFVQLTEDRWQPIVVHKVGESYYVGNGQFQVSVARHTGMKFIEAEVWDHSLCRTSDGPCPSKHKMARPRTESFSTN